MLCPFAGVFENFKSTIKKESTMSLVKWTPKRSYLTPFEDWDNFLTDFFGDFRNEPAYETRNWSPAVDIHETDDEYVVTADLPGLRKKDIHVNVKDNVLTISGERKAEEKEGKLHYRRTERFYGSFQRCFRLPDQVQEAKIGASFKDGVLTVNLPKAEEVRSKEVDIKIA